MRLLQAISVAGADVNEDLIWHDAGDAVVLDGSSSLLSGGHDAVGFVRALVAAFERANKADAPLYQRINQAVDEIRADFAPEGYEGGIVPSAAGVFASERGDTLEVVSVADCTALLLGTKGDVIRVRDHGIDGFDGAAIDLAVEVSQKAGVSVRDAMASPEVRELLLANRRMMNRPGGYRALASNMAPLKGEDMRVFDLSQVAEVVLFSDGFDAAEGDFEGGPIDLGETFKRLRDEERADATLCARPRFKQHDDVSAMYLRVSQIA